ncbi:ATP-binding protein [Desulfoluna spongiiphila]|uniref:tRNA 2-thiocytidine biosynthesis protein TtcA n=1 Tax=Desulfoluna spongiiphila TaxID=419481 RepID=A0A1G5FPS5_9BACT|nr:ATP-binding protein [Desulfoluna spongiiphila]SCY41154.1 tRNA 2-thiocytidine biosynthesis protein TtcA [Desulfoluna spongiiphila]
MIRETRIYQRINRAMGKAIHQYDMIEDGDRIALGLSGGKDSLTLLTFLVERLRRVPVTYSIHPVYIDPGFDGGFADELAAHCRDLGLTLTCEHTNHGPEAHKDTQSANPCFICSRLRRKRLFELTSELGCRTLALGHNKDDVIETLLINMFYSGQISTMMPNQSMFGGEVTVIRPLYLAEESDIVRFASEQGLPVYSNPCPSAAVSKRREIKDLLESLSKANPHVKGNLFRSLSQVRLDYLLT